MHECENAVQIEDADQLAGEIEDLQARLDERRQRLQRIAETWVRPPTGRPYPLRITARAVQALS